MDGTGGQDVADVVLSFGRRARVPGHGPVSAFDRAMDGRIDFADVVWLFNRL